MAIAIVTGAPSAAAGATVDAASASGRNAVALAEGAIARPAQLTMVVRARRAQRFDVGVSAVCSRGTLHGLATRSLTVRRSRRLRIPLPIARPEVCGVAVVSRLLGTGSVVARVDARRRARAAVARQAQDPDFAPTGFDVNRLRETLRALPPAPPPGSNPAIFDAWFQREGYRAELGRMLGLRVRERPYPGDAYAFNTQVLDRLSGRPPLADYNRRILGQMSSMAAVLNNVDRQRRAPAEPEPDEGEFTRVTIHNPEPGVTRVLGIVHPVEPGARCGPFDVHDCMIRCGLGESRCTIDVRRGNPVGWATEIRDPAIVSARFTGDQCQNIVCLVNTAGQTSVDVHVAWLRRPPPG